MKLSVRRPLITGASRGIGRAFVDEFLEAGAERIYAGVRDSSSARRLASVDERVVPIMLDTTHADEISAAAAAITDLDVLVNNAGVSFNNGFLSAPSLDDARREMEVNFFGPLALARAFARSLVRNRGAIVNVLSIAGLMHVQHVGSYNSSKAAARSMTLGLRGDMAPHGVRVLAIYPAGYDTDMANYVTDKTGLFPPRMLTRAVLSALVDGAPDDVYPDPASQTIARMVLGASAVPGSGGAIGNRASERSPSQT